mmetsp:Transcript_18708/g.66639  ORF Transcript_18708/g.66639 Transcript_18708/m.66639 type:complete len:376 (+) Transcript_18708:3848-4975(+)
MREISATIKEPAFFAASPSSLRGPLRGAHVSSRQPKYDSKQASIGTMSWASTPPHRASSKFAEHTRRWQHSSAAADAESSRRQAPAAAVFSSQNDASKTGRTHSRQSKKATRAAESRRSTRTKRTMPSTSGVRARSAVDALNVFANSSRTKAALSGVALPTTAAHWSIANLCSAAETWARWSPAASAARRFTATGWTRTKARFTATSCRSESAESTSAPSGWKDVESAASSPMTQSHAAATTASSFGSSTVPISFRGFLRIHSPKPYWHHVVAAPSSGSMRTTARQARDEPWLPRLATCSSASEHSAGAARQAAVTSASAMRSGVSPPRDVKSARSRASEVATASWMRSRMRYMSSSGSPLASHAGAEAHELPSA